MLSVAKFAKDVLEPLAPKMDEESHMPKSLINDLFANGVSSSVPSHLVSLFILHTHASAPFQIMGIEILHQYGGSGASFFASILAIEEIAKVDMSVSVLVDVQNTLINTLINSLGTEEQKQKYLSRLATDTVSTFSL